MYFIFVKHKNFNYILYHRIQVVNLEEVVNMKKTTLYLIADIVNSVESSNQKLYELLDTMNLLYQLLNIKLIFSYLLPPLN